jgi:hypothetical protein
LVSPRERAIRLSPDDRLHQDTLAVEFRDVENVVLDWLGAELDRLHGIRTGAPYDRGYSDALNDVARTIRAMKHKPVLS